MTHRLILALLAASFAPSAFAYIDPGSGSAIMSAIVGFFVAAGLAIKTYWYKLKGLFVGKKATQESADVDGSDHGEA